MCHSYPSVIHTMNAAVLAQYSTPRITCDKTKGSGVSLRVARYLGLILLGGIMHDTSWSHQWLSMLKYSKPNYIHLVFVKQYWPLVAIAVHLLSTFTTCLVRSTSTGGFYVTHYLKRRYARFTTFVLIWYLTQEFFDYFLQLTSYCPYDASKWTKN